MATAAKTAVPGGPVRYAAAAAAVLGVLLTGCAAASGGDDAPARHHGTQERAGHGASADPEDLPGVGDRFRSRIPERTGQVVLVRGRGPDAAASRVELWNRNDGGTWHLDERWSGHNGRGGWTEDHHEGDKRSPAGVFTLTDAGGVRAAPDGTRLPYIQSPAFTPPAYWDDRTEHDFDHVIAIDYNRVPGTSPLDPTRPRGQDKGGFIWLHVDNGTGTSGCVSVPDDAMEHLLSTLDPDRHPVIVMGDRGTLRG
ncbi:L,D-transpeptidase family protein [Streptomyces sp. TR06-5]|uniref:L,D-transpeptidase family protein n=1 Tax=unclassified Streptomyces TaxID=2593676 RepID=UPI0039A19B1B